MSSRQVEATTYMCNAPSCGVEHTVADGNAAPGYNMLVLVAEGGVPSAPREVEAYACQITHVRGAVEAVTAEIRRGAKAQAGESEPDESEPGAPETSGDEDAADEPEIEQGPALEPAGAQA